MSKVRVACALCDSQWGNYWKQVNDKRLFFCCEICAKQYINLIQKIKHQTGWEEFDALEINEKVNQRFCIVKKDNTKRVFEFHFNSQTELSLFSEQNE